MGSEGPTVGMDASGLTTARMVATQLSLLLLLSGDTHALKNCDNCVAVDDCRRWCTKLQMGLSNLTLDERAEFNDNICGFDSNADPAVKLCCDSPAERDACKKVKCGQILVEGDAQCGGCDDVSSPGAWPWVTRILYQANFDSADNNETTYCGGALVSARHVVTAAHCVDTQEGEPVAVDLGELDVRSEYDCHQTVDECGASGNKGRACFEEGRCAARRERYKVKSSLVHPRYKKRFGSGKNSKPQFDVAVLVLDRPVQFTTMIQPVCLPPPQSEKESASRFFVLKGWGNIVKGFGAGKSARVLQELKGLKETPLDECRKLVGRVASLETHHMCVWKRGSGSNGCQGDSGGPVSELIRQNTRDKGHWDLAGVVSFGVHSACASNTPLVVTRVSEPTILNWIKAMIGEDLPYRP